jgi:hypothetical protein
MLCAKAGVDAASNTESRNGNFVIAEKVAAAAAKVEREISPEKIPRRVRHTEKEKGRVQNTRPFLHS